MRGLLLDTCAVLFFSGEEPVRKAAREMVAASLESGHRLNVSPCTAWELGMLVTKGRLRLPQKPDTWFRSLLSRDELDLAPLSPEVLTGSSFLPGDPPPDPADRIFAATARELGLTLVTRDRALLAYADAGHINAIEC